ncbi:MAG: response regulator [Kiritimatiellae bacterium]|nr:response regulator [Kiritimatiellia bacterium]
MKKILSIDDEPTMLRCLKQALEREGYTLLTTSDPDEGLEIIKNDPDICLVLLDVKMPKKSGFEIYSEILEFRKIPVLFVTAYPRSFNAQADNIAQMWQDGFADGTTDIVYKPFHLDTLFEKVEGLVGLADDKETTKTLGEPAPKKILAIDDEATMLHCIDKALSRKGYTLIVTGDPEEALNILKDDEDIQLVLIDVKMPKKNGFELFNELREFRNIPVLFVTAYPRSFNVESENIVEMWENKFTQGITDIVYKPFHLNTLFEKVEGLIGNPEDSSGDKK